MVFTNNLVSYASTLMETCDSQELQERLGLYQVFLKLYEHRRELLDEILGLENSGSKDFASITMPYVQGIIAQKGAQLVTNLLQGMTQTLVQPEQTWLIGRDPQQVMIPIQDKRLSRCHAALKYVEHSGFYLIDLDSRNGSYVNGELIRKSRLLCDGDRIRLGSVTFVFLQCQSTQQLSTLPSEAQRLLQNWHPSPTPRPNAIWQTEDWEEPTEGSPALPNPLDKTDRFMKPALGSKKS